MSELILGPIIGGLSHNRVNLWARADGPATLHAWIGRDPDGRDAAPAGKTGLGSGSGFAGIVSVEGLDASTRYAYALTLNAGAKPPAPAFHTFITLPSPGVKHPFRFAFGSCFLPFRKSPGQAFHQLLEKRDELSFILLLGDQIYADNIQQNGIGRVALSLEDYRSVYRNTWSNLHYHSLLERVPAFMILDDHEIDNDWHWRDPALTSPAIGSLTSIFRFLQRRPAAERSLSKSRVLAGLQANWEHQALHAPSTLPPNGPLAFSFEVGAAAFFILDTRTHRFLGRDRRELLGEDQWTMLIDWLKRVKDTHPVKFIVTSISILSDLLGDWTADRWTGFREERDRLLFFLAREGIEGVHFLAGDLHSAHSISAELSGPDGHPIPVREFCSSPFEQKPNHLAGMMDWPAHSPALKRRKREYTVAAINYGIVDVDFPDGNPPRVTFELYYEKKGVWRRK